MVVGTAMFLEITRKPYGFGDLRIDCQWFIHTSGHFESGVLQEQLHVCEIL